MRAKLVVAVIIVLLGAVADMTWRKGSVIALFTSGIGGSIAGALKGGEHVVLAAAGSGSGKHDQDGGASCGDDMSIVKQTIDWPQGQSRLSWGGHSRMTYRPGAAAQPTVEGPAAAVKHIKISDGKISYDCKWRGGEPELVLSGVAIDHFSVSGSGTLQLDDLRQPALAVSISGSGAVDGSGQADSITLSVSGSSHIDLGKLAAKTANVSVSGSADARLAVSDSADITINGVGHIHWSKKPPVVHSHIHGMGEIDDSES